MIPTAWQLAVAGMGFVALFATWKWTIGSRLSKRAHAHTS